MKKTGYIVTALGLIGFSLIYSLAYTNFYIEQLYREHWPTVGKYFEQLTIPLLLSAAVIIMGIVLICKKEEPPKE